MHLNNQHGLKHNTHIDGRVTEVLDVFGAHVERRLTGHEECWRQSREKQTNEFTISKWNQANTNLYCESPIVMYVSTFMEDSLQ